MKTLINSIIFLLLTSGVFAQQDIISKVSNGFFRDNGMKDLKEINALYKKLNLEYFGEKSMAYVNDDIEEVGPKTSYHQIGYRVSTGQTSSGTRTRTSGSTYDGLLRITWAEIPKTTPSKNIETFSKENYRFIYDTEEKANFVTDYVKNDNIEGSFIYSKKGNLIIFIILSKTKPELVRGSITINLPESDRSTFARDFIGGTKFEPNTGRSSSGGRTRTGSDTSTGTRTDSSSTRTGGGRTRTGS